MLWDLGHGTMVNGNNNNIKILSSGDSCSMLGCVHCVVLYVVKMAYIGHNMRLYNYSIFQVATDLMFAVTDLSI